MILDLPTGPPTEIDTEVDARDLLARLSLDGWGLTSPSVYETARLVSLAPWLTGHAERIGYLLAGQRPDGGWGPPEGYALVPTLSAVEALLTTLARDAPDGHPSETDGSPGAGSPGASGSPGADATGAGGPAARVAELALATRRGLRALDTWLAAGSGLSIPDTPAIDLIVPALVERINRHLDRSAEPPIGWPDRGRLPLPAGITTRRLDAVRRLVAAGAAIPEKLLHTLEVLGPAAGTARSVAPASPGTIGASPAATAAWLGATTTRGVNGPARDFLTSVVRRGSGPVPCATPITAFERSWVLSGLIRSGIRPVASASLTNPLVAALGPAGIATGPGLPADADTTSVTLYVLSRLGVPVDGESLWRYDTGEHFCTWIGEDGCSVSTNAHVLEALGAQVAPGPDADERRSGAGNGQPGAGNGRPGTDERRIAAIHRLTDWLRQQQCPDGRWLDRWHASPYYATMTCCLALRRYGVGDAAADAVSRAVAWVLATQRPDGSWGRWTGTTEETAYAMQVLLTPGWPAGDPVASAAARGYNYLRTAAADRRPDPPLWHDKDLYLPPNIVRAATLAARRLARARPEVMKLANLSM